MNTPMRLFVIGFISSLFVAPVFASAASFEVTGWIPYWRSATGTVDVLPHLDKVTEVNPFVYTLKSDGTLYDNGTIEDTAIWASFNAQAHAKGVRVIPTVMSGDRDTMHAVLSNTQLRANLVQSIVTLVNTQGHDGIDIDFEFKRAETKDHFSVFLRELKQGLGANKWLMCTIETRIPAEDRYYGTTIPEDAGQYSNDLQQINQHCDRVRLMAYDQQGIDLKLRTDAGDRLYAPVGDPAWVEKVVNYMSKDIDKSKMLIGVPTYGYEYVVTPTPNNKFKYQYDILWTFNPGYGTQQAAKFNVTPERAFWGDMAFTYINSDMQTAPVSGTMGALTAAAAASQYVAMNNAPVSFRYVVWPDAQSMQQKIDLAKRLGVRGISIFKFDGGQDPNMWNVLANAAVKDPSALPSAPVAGTTTPTPGGNTGVIVGAKFSRTLNLNSVGQDVLTLQKILNTDSATRVATSGAGAPGKETTKLGSLTLAALKKFQVKHGIAKAGVAGYGTVGPKTRAKLNTFVQ